MMVQPTKKQKVEETTSYKEEVLFNSDTLSKIISYLPSIDLLNLALTCKKFGVSNNTNDDSIIEESTWIAIKDIATEEELAVLPYIMERIHWTNYHYLQFMRGPLTFDQLVGNIDYVNREDKSCVKNNNTASIHHWATAFSNTILRAGKHYVSFTSHSNTRSSMMGVMRPGQANESARLYPLYEKFYQNFFRNMGHGEHNNNNVHCCMYYTYSGKCGVSDWSGTPLSSSDWDGMESMRYGGTIGMLLDLDEGTLTVYKNGRKLGVMKRGLVGEYCWIASMWNGTSVSIKRGTIPPS